MNKSIRPSQKLRAVQATDFLRRWAENAMRGRPLFEPVGRVWPRTAAHSQPGADPSLAQAEKLHTPKKRIIKQLENYMTRPDARYGDSIQKIKNQYPDLLKSLGLPSEQNDVRAAVILSQCKIEINARNIRLIKELDVKLTKLINGFHPKIAESFLESGQNPLEAPLDNLLAYINEFEGRFDKFEKTDIAGLIRDVKPAIRPAVISLNKAFHIIMGNEGAALGYALNSGNSGTLGALLDMADSYNANVNYAVSDITPIKERIMHENSIRAEIKRACEYGKALLTT